MTGKPTAVMNLGDREGMWRFYVYYRGSRVDVTTFRKAPTELLSLSTTDPYGPAEASVKFPAITVLEQYGAGELYWFHEERHIDIVWTSRPVGDTDWDNATEDYVWEGYMLAPDWEQIGATVACVGALRQFDNYLAKPAYLARPLPYEEAIRRALLPQKDNPCKELVTYFPVGWPTRFHQADFPTSQPFMLPEGRHLYENAPWTGLLTRETGKFEPVLTSYVQGILQNMQSAEGPWTVRLNRFRRPQLLIRRRPNHDDYGIYYADVASPGLSKGFSARRDGGQKANVVYAQGKGITGSQYSGMHINVLGNRTTTGYDPYAFSRQVHPVSASNPWLNTETMRKEVSIPIGEGLTEAEVYKVSQLHLQRFSDPGITGEFVLTEDPVLHTVDGDINVPRQTVTAGASFLLFNLLGNTQGELVHVVQTAMDNEGNVTCTYDNRYRDQMTVEEVRRRGRDSMRPARLLSIGGNYEPIVKDLLFPWSYERGSGYLPRDSPPLWRGGASATRQFESLEFPWTELTTQRPPKSPAWTKCYMRIGPTDYSNAKNNWGVYPSTKCGYPVLLAATGDIRKIQVAAYDEDGNVLPVRFHVSLWYESSISPSAMPLIPPGRVGDGSYPSNYVSLLNQAKGRPELGVSFDYKASQPYPFYKDAFNQGYEVNGQKIISARNYATRGATMIFGFGNGYEKAGYWPGTQESTAPITGMLSEEGQWSFDFLYNTTRFVSGESPAKTQRHGVNLIKAYLMIFCDDHGDEPVYFLGRAYRAEPGSS